MKSSFNNFILGLSLMVFFLGLLLTTSLEIFICLSLMILGISIIFLFTHMIKSSILLFFVLSEISTSLVLVSFQWNQSSLTLIAVSLKMGLWMTLFVKLLPSSNIEMKEWMLWSSISVLPVFWISSSAFNMTLPVLMLMFVIILTTLIFPLSWNMMSLAVSSSISQVFLWGVLNTSNPLISVLMIFLYSTLLITVLTDDKNDVFGLINMASFPISISFFVKFFLVNSLQLSPILLVGIITLSMFLILPLFDMLSKSVNSISTNSNPYNFLMITLTCVLVMSL